MPGKLCRKRHSFMWAIKILNNKVDYLEKRLSTVSEDKIFHLKKEIAAFKLAIKALETYTNG